MRIVSKVAVWGLLVVIFGLAAAAVRVSNHHPTSQAVHSGTTKTDDDHKTAESIWTPSTWEPITTLTVALATFTFVLAVVSLLQARYIIRADETARIAADAAKKAADTAERALSDYERPWIFRDVVTIKIRDPINEFSPPPVNRWWISTKWKNVGRNPAIIKQFQFAITDVNALAVTPDYTKCSPLGVVPTLAEGAEFDTSEVGPNIATHLDGTPIDYIFWGRLIYADMSGTVRVSGFALMVAPRFAAALEHNSDAYNYYT